jgi:hypothetical protein
MNWEEKTKMIQHFNNEDYEQGTEVFLNNIDIVDQQAIDMFFTGIDLTKETLYKSINNHKIIAEKLKDTKSESFRTAMRMALYEELISENQNQ